MTSLITQVGPLLAHHQKIIEEKIREKIPNLGPKTRLRDACEYALLTEGKRFRPALVFLMAKSLGKSNDVTEAALAVEFFHTASLIADDLPCMDDDDLRRDRPSLHKAFDESTALLASYALISAGYECLAINTNELDAGGSPFGDSYDRACVLALENATHNTGLHGATGGQFEDLDPPDFSLETLRGILHKKTVSLFEISFVFGWLFGGGDVKKYDLVKKAASHFGMAFQIADDLGDMEQDKRNGRLVNFGNIFGEKQAQEMLKEELQGFSQTLKSLDIQSKEFTQIALFLKNQMK